jgi:DNA-binding NarL/FixJ family response regulator
LQFFADGWVMELTLTAPAKNRRLTVNEAGHLIGESHPRAVLTDHEVDLLLELLAEGLSQARVALAMEVSRRTVRDIASGRTRAQIPARLIVRRKD